MSSTTRAVVYLFAAVFLILAPSQTQAAAVDLEAVLEGEFALQEGDLSRAARRYVEAALASTDPALAERATQIAILAEEDSQAAKALAHWRRIAGGNDAMTTFEALIAARGNRPVEAASALSKLLRAGDDPARMALRLLQVDIDSTTTVAILEALSKDASRSWPLEALLGLAATAERVGLEGQADLWTMRALAAYPNEPRLLLWQAERHRKSNDLDAARANLERALVGEPDIALRRLAASVAGRLGEPAYAAEILARGEQDSATLVERALYLARVDDKVGIAEIYDTVVAGELEIGADEKAMLLGQLAEFIDREAAALAAYQKIQDGPLRARAWLRSAAVLDKLNNHDEALSVLHDLQASELDDGEAIRDAYLLEAELLLGRSQAEEALKAFERGLEIFEGDPAILYARALAFEQLDRIDLAERDFRLILDADPENADALNALGYTLADRTDRLEEARGYIEQALKQSPDNPAIIDSLGWVLYRLGKADEALPLLERAFRLERDPEIAAHLGEVLWQLGQRAEAKSIWRLGQELDPDNRTLVETLGRLKP